MFPCRPYPKRESSLVCSPNRAARARAGAPRPVERGRRRRGAAGEFRGRTSTQYCIQRGAGGGWRLLQVQLQVLKFNFNPVPAVSLHW